MVDGPRDVDVGELEFFLSVSGMPRLVVAGEVGTEVGVFMGKTGRYCCCRPQWHLSVVKDLSFMRRKIVKKPRRTLKFSLCALFR